MKITKFQLQNYAVKTSNIQIKSPFIRKKLNQRVLSGSLSLAFRRTQFQHSQ